MNFSGKIFLVSLIFVFSSIPVFSQTSKEYGSPIIQNYTDNDYGTESPQNWATVQDHKGVMYFGNTEGVLQYDGKKWRLIKITNNSIPWSLAIDSNGTIYVGAVDEFGYLSPNPQGKPVYVSLSPKLKETDRNCGDLRDICIVGTTTYFIGRNNIYAYKDSVVNVIKSGFSNIRGFSVNNELLLWQRETGIYTLKNNKLVLIPFSNAFITNFKECIILPFCNTKLLIGTRENGFSLFDTERAKSSGNNSEKSIIIPFKTEADKYLNINRLITGCRINKEQFAFGTLSGGIVIIDREGELLQVINKNRGLASNGIYCMYQDKNNNLWAGLVNGISKIEINSPVTKFDESNGFDGLVLAVKYFNGRTYIGTTSGVYYLPEYNMQTSNDRFTFKHIKNTEVSCWDFMVINNRLITSGPLGMVEIKDTIAIKINEIGQIISFSQSRLFPGRIFAGLRNGLVSVVFSKNNITAGVSETFRHNDINTAIWRPMEDTNGDIWFSDKYNGLFQIHFLDPHDFKNYKIIKYDTSDGLPKMDYNYPFLINNEIFAGTQKGIYKAVKGKNKPFTFISENTFGSYFNERKLDVKQIELDGQGKIWIKSDKQGMCYLTKDINDKYKLVDQPFRGTGYVFKFFITDRFIWMCTNHGVFKYDSLLSKKYDIPFNVLIRKVASDKDTVYYWGTETPQNTKNVLLSLPYKANSLYFEFAAPFYENEDKTEYCYFLEGFDKICSKWTKETKKEYTNLREGHYVFHVKARNIYGAESTDEVFGFTIKPPWYRTFLAYFFYAALFILIIYLVIKLNSRRLNERNRKLENLVKERTSEVEQQKEELQTQAEHLEISNRELEKLSIVARETDNAIIIMDAEGNFEWINESLKKMNGYSSFEQFIKEDGKNLKECSSSPRINEILEECRKTKKAVIYDNFTITKRGANIWAQTTISPILNAEGEVIKLVAIDSDITKIKEAEEEIKQQNEEITSQREMLAKTNFELKRTNKLITDSIKYSKRIQDAILPSEKLISKHFPDSFIFYKPRDIVSGDFYWMSFHGSKEYFAVVDCTGHGVPGALMSMIGNTLLNEIVNEKMITDPATILKLLSFRVVASLEKGRESDDIQSDGMDITLCCFDCDTNELTLACANSVALFMTKDGVKKIIGDVYSIGDIFSHNQNVVFKNHIFNVNEGDSLYLYSDGYQDQFGGEYNEKFMAAQFETLLENFQELSMEKQLSKLSSTFESWKGSGKQTDDVLVMGVRFHF